MEKHYLLDDNSGRKDSLVVATFISISEHLDHKEIHPTEVASVLIMLMKTVEKYSQFDGASKKYVVLEVMKKYVKEKSTPRHREFMLNMVRKVLPDMIDYTIQIDKNTIQIHKKNRLLFWRK